MLPHAGEPTVFDRLFLNRIRFLIIQPTFNTMIAFAEVPMNIAGMLFEQIFNLGGVNFDTRSHRRRNGNSF
jgi:hypothetical protein